MRGDRPRTGRPARTPRPTPRTVPRASSHDALLLQRQPQRPQPVVQARLHGPFRHAELDGDLARGATEVVGVHDDGAVIGGEGREGVGDQPRVEAFVDLVADPALRHLVDTHLVQRVRAPARVDDEVPRHREQPGPGRAVALVEDLRPTPRLDERLLHDVIRLGAAAGEMDHVPPQRGGVLRLQDAQQPRVIALHAVPSDRETTTPSDGWFTYTVGSAAEPALSPSAGCWQQRSMTASGPSQEAFGTPTRTSGTRPPAVSLEQLRPVRQR